MLYETTEEWVLGTLVPPKICTLLAICVMCHKLHIWFMLAIIISRRPCMKIRPMSTSTKSLGLRGYC